MHRNRELKGVGRESWSILVVSFLQGSCIVNLVYLLSVVKSSERGDIVSTTYLSLTFDAARVKYCLGGAIRMYVNPTHETLN